MPFYEVSHSYPLTGPQKAAIAERITFLHSRAFTTPSMFVNVSFQAVDASHGNYYFGGKVKSDCLNRIQAFVRTSEQRTKEHFDKLAADIENAWLEILGEKAPGGDEEAQKKFEKEKKDKQQSSAETAAKQLMIIRFVPMLTVREKGFVIPAAGQEADWIKQNRKIFEDQAAAGDEDIKDMLDEINERDDLKEWRA